MINWLLIYMLIPYYIIEILAKLTQSDKEAFIVGGCVRDLLMASIPKDWDITTSARPEEILKIIPDTRYENNFGTVLSPVKAVDGQAIACVEITTYRSEQGYSDRRHPDKIIFEDELEKDLARRDFTVNAMAIKVKSNKLPSSRAQAEGEVKNEKYLENVELSEDDIELIDLFGGKKDIKKKIIRAVGEPTDRFKEDALRMMRAIRLSCQLGFELEPKTERAITKLAGSIKFIAKERIKDELIKILVSAKPAAGIKALHNDKLLNYIIPEIEKGVDMEQNRHHIYNIFEHSLLSLKYCPNSDWRVRLAAWLHDIAKPQTRKVINGQITFYNHEIAGAKITAKIMKRLKFSTTDTIRVVNLVKNHMFYYNVDEVTAASVRRLIVKVGPDNLKDLIDLRVADRLGSGVPKAKPYKLRHLEYMLKKVQSDVVTVKMLAINGYDLMTELPIKPGPKLGAILDVLLSEVIKDQNLNQKEYLLAKARQLNETDLDKLHVKAKAKIKDKNIEKDGKLKKEFWV